MLDFLLRGVVAYPLICHKPSVRRRRFGNLPQSTEHIVGGCDPVLSHITPANETPSLPWKSVRGGVHSLFHGGGRMDVMRQFLWGTFGRPACVICLFGHYLRVHETFSQINHLAGL
jgi:hypothetical protein